MTKANVVAKPITFSLPVEASENINQVAAARVAEKLPMIDKATRAFDRNNSATTLSLPNLFCIFHKHLNYFLGDFHFP